MNNNSGKKLFEGFTLVKTTRKPKTKPYITKRRNTKSNRESYFLMIPRTVDEKVREFFEKNEYVTLLVNFDKKAIAVVDINTTKSEFGDEVEEGKRKIGYEKNTKALKVNITLPVKLLQLTDEEMANAEFEFRGNGLLIKFK